MGLILTAGGGFVGEQLLGWMEAVRKLLSRWAEASNAPLRSARDFATQAPHCPAGERGQNAVFRVPVRRGGRAPWAETSPTAEGMWAPWWPPGHIDYLDLDY